MHPVKIGVVHNGHERKGKNKIQDSMLLYIEVELGMLRQFRAAQYGGGDKRHDEHRGDRETNFPGIVFKPGIALLYFFRPEHTPE